MGCDKAALVLAGKTLAERAVDRLALAASDVHLCGWNSDCPAPAPVLADPMQDAGPLAPLVSALEHSSQMNDAGLALVLAVDLPLVPWELLQWLVSRAHLTGAMVTIPGVEDRPQPLCAVYSAALAPRLRDSLLQGERKLMRAIESACAPDRLDKFILGDVLPPGRRESLSQWFLNVNTPEDLVAAEEAMRTPRVW